MWHDNKREGFGRATFANGDKYEGGWSNDMRNGEGRMEYANGEIYIGGWKDGRKYGVGIRKELYPSGDEYEGMFGVA